MASGTSLAYRVVIEGLGVEFVSDAAMEQTTSDGRKRIACTRIFEAGGMTVGESVDPARAEMEAEGMTLELTDVYDDGGDSITGDLLTHYLAIQPSTYTYLTADVATTGAASLTVLSTSQFSAADVIHLGTECMLVDSVTDSTHLAILSTGRGYRDTIAAAHYTADGENLRQPAVSLTYPTTIEGRRVVVYEYEDGDALTGDGTAVWRGRCNKDAELSADGCTWRIAIKGLADITKEDLGADLGAPLTPRGIYYPSNVNFAWTIQQLGTDVGSAVADSLPVYVSELGARFFKDNEALCAALNEAFLAKSWASALTWDNPRFIADGNDGYHLEYTTDATTAAAFSVQCEYRILEGELTVMKAQGADAALADGTTLSTSTNYRVYGFGADDWRGARTTPRGVFGMQRATEERATGSDSPFRIYVDGTRDLTRFRSIMIRFFDANAAVEQVYNSVFITASERSITANTAAAFGAVVGSGPLEPIHVFNSLTRPEVYVARSYGVGTLRRFYRRLTEIGPLEANRGGAPLITAGSGTSARGDIDLADLNAELLKIEAQGVSFRARRSYTFPGGDDLEELLTHEHRLWGVFPVITAEGRLSVRQLVQATDEQTPDFAIVADDIIGMPSWERNGLGCTNIVGFKTGYEYQTDDHEGVRISVRDVQAISTRKASKELEIAPRSRTVGSDPLTYDEAVAIAAPVLGTFGHPYSVYSVTVKRELADGTSWRNMTLGSVCTISAPWLPDTRTGQRGLTAKAAIVIGRSYILGEPTANLTLLSSDVALFGYSPTVYADGDDVTSASHTLTVSFSDPLSSLTTKQSGAALSDFFAVGDRIDVLEWNNAAPTVRPGAVATVTDPATLAITLDASATLSIGTDYVIRYVDAADTPSGTQDDYAYLAADDGEIDFATVKPARRFGA